jgi:hypothetical protein
MIVAAEARAAKAFQMAAGWRLSTGARPWPRDHRDTFFPLRPTLPAVTAAVADAGSRELPDVRRRLYPQNWTRPQPTCSRRVHQVFMELRPWRRDKATTACESA